MPTKAKRKTAKKRNPGMQTGPHHKKSRSAPKKRNPNGAGGRLAGVSGNAVGIVKSGFFALVGLVLARQLPQTLLGAKNTGAMGYVANFATALVAGYVVGNFAGKDAGAAVGIGGGLYTVQRVLNEKVSPVGAILSLQGIGDASAASKGDMKRGGMGEIVYDGRAYFPMPVAWDASGMNPVIPQQIRPIQPTPMLPAVGMGGGSSRFRSRFA